MVVGADRPKKKKIDRGLGWTRRVAGKVWNKGRTNQVGNTHMQKKSIGGPRKQHPQPPRGGGGKVDHHERRDPGLPHGGGVPGRSGHASLGVSAHLCEDGDGRHHLMTLDYAASHPRVAHHVLPPVLPQPRRKAAQPGWGYMAASLRRNRIFCAPPTQSSEGVPCPPIRDAGHTPPPGKREKARGEGELRPSPPHTREREEPKHGGRGWPPRLDPLVSRQPTSATSARHGRVAEYGRGPHPWALSPGLATSIRVGRSIVANHLPPGKIMPGIKPSAWFCRWQIIATHALLANHRAYGGLAGTYRHYCFCL